ncbi:NAD-dependent epimerase/dehydratase family protein [Aeromonas enterica]
MSNVQAPVGRDGQTPQLPRSVFVTGANGFIGRGLMDRYQALGVETRGMDLHADPARNVVAGDLTQPQNWASHAQGCELFINTAAVVSLAAPWQLYREVSVHGVGNALDVAIAGGAKRFLHYSSVAAMGWDFPDQADEKACVMIGPDYRYGVAKGASEHVVLAAHAAGEIDCTIIRPGDVYGPGSRAWISEPYKMAKAGTLVLPAHGNGVFSPVYVDDLLDGTLLAAGLPQGCGQIFILSGGAPITCREFFTHHWHWAGRSGAPRALPTALALLLTRLIWGANRLLQRHDEACPDAIHMLARRGDYSIEKAKNLLGYQPKMSLEEGLRRSEDWLRATGQMT